MNGKLEGDFGEETYSGVWHHHVAGAVVALLPYFVQPILGLRIVDECVNHVGCVGLCGGRATLHSAPLRIVTFRGPLDACGWNVQPNFARSQ